MRDLIRDEQGVITPRCKMWIPKEDRERYCTIAWLRDGLNKDFFLRDLMNFRRREQSCAEQYLRPFLREALDAGS